MKEDVPRSGDGVMLAADFPERMQLFWFRHSEQPTPGVRAERHDARQSTPEIAETHGAQQRSQITAKVSHGGLRLRSRVQFHHEENGGARQLRNYGLRNREWHAALLTVLAANSLPCALEGGANRAAHSQEQRVSTANTAAQSPEEHHAG
jgi:hypothetical protein